VDPLEIRSTTELDAMGFTFSGPPEVLEKVLKAQPAVWSCCINNSFSFFWCFWPSAAIEAAR